MRITKVIVPEFFIYKPTTIKRSDSVLLSSQLEISKEQYYTYEDDTYEINIYCHFPLLILPDDSIWQYVSRFFLYKLESLETPHSSTLNSIANSIKYFGEYCLDNEIDYLVCTRRSNSPLRRYRRYLTDRIVKKELSPSTAKSHISNLVNFYRYLVDIENVNFDYLPWEDKEAKVMISDVGSGGYVKIVKTSDISQCIKGKVSTPKKLEFSKYEGKIIDDGELRPLNNIEQKVLLMALKELNHPEMNLIFLIGLCTGARLQTILTLRYDNFNCDYDDSIEEVAIYAGRYNKYGNGLVDSKADKSITIYFPIKLYEKVQLYLKSERAAKRRAKSKYKPEKTELHYIFLSQHGNPLYISKFDENTKNYRTPPSGQAVTSFIFERLKPKLTDLNFNGSFKFHDIRATFGMNIVNFGLERINDTDNLKGSIDQLFRFVKTRMCHSQLSTTQQYLDFNNNNKVVKEAKLGWEKHLKEMLEILNV